VTRGRIAAIVTCRDLGRFLDEALASVERQTRPAAEIVVVDDQSDDIHTRQVLARIAHGGTRVVLGDGRGASAARNLGGAGTTADYLVWLDADDVFEPQYFEKAAERLDNDEGLDFVSCAMRAFGDASYRWTPAEPSLVAAIATGAVPHASTMMRRTLWLRTGGFDESLPTFELLDFWASALESGARGVIVDEPLLRYRVRSGSGYRRSIQDATYRARMEHFYAKHRDAVQRRGIELILAKEAFNESQRAYRDTLESRAAALEGELADLQRAIAETTAALAARGLHRVDWGDLGRVAPLSPRWGRDRGTPIDRYYIERFIAAHQADVRGRVLEVREPMYTQRFGAGRVTRSDVVDRDPGNPRAAVVADLRDAAAIPSAAYDCIIVTQTLHLVDDIAAAVRECARLLKPGGTLLVTAPSVIRVDDEAGRDADFWRLTEASARTLFARAFPIDAFEVSLFGNVKVCAAFLYGISVEEMTAADLDDIDPQFPLGVAIRAVKPRAAAPEGVRNIAAASRVASSNRGVILCYHRIADLAPDSHALCTPPAVFREHMIHLRDRCTPIALDDLVRAAAAGAIPERAVAVTFDDGYLDALRTASPILVEHGVPATFFVNSDRLDEEHERWWDILERVFLTEPHVPARLSLRVAGHDLDMRTAGSGERAAALESLNRTAWTLDADGRRQLAADVLAWSGAAAPPRVSHRVMTAGEIRALAQRPGHAIGAHTVHHLALTCHDAATKRREIDDDRRALEHRLGRAVDLFSYPYGELDAETIAAVRDAGFRAAVTVESGAVAAGTNRLLLPRVEITRDLQRRFGEYLDTIFSSDRLTVAAVSP